MSDTAAVPGPTRAKARARSRSGWLTAQRWRLASGLVLFAFALSHFLNHALGHISVEAMEAVQDVRRGVWRSWPGTVLLYGALSVHVALAFTKLLGRRTWRMTLSEALQIALGLLIPFMAVAHVMATRGVSAATGFDDTYTAELRLLWPGLATSQSLLLIVVWVHAMIGFHHWLRSKPWYARWQPLLLVAAVVVPTLAVTGWISAARRLALKTFDAPPMTDAMLQAGGELIGTGQMVVGTVFAVAAFLLAARRMIDWFRVGPTVAYPNGRKVKGTAGSTLLEISRAAGVPHAAICGGRGRCTTCRVMVVEGLDDLPAPNATEAAALARIDAPPGVRLACQVRPGHAVKVRPLVHRNLADPATGGDAYRWGVERRITVMFTDLRGFTTLAERLYPYDSVFLLNRYFEVMSEAIERRGGEVDKFLGDGIMALFGVAPARGSGARDAILASRDMIAAIARLNLEFEATLPEPLRMGIGLHSGPVVLGRVGGGKGGLTALGDTVNIASRLETLNKELGSTLVMSEDVLQASKLVLDGCERLEVPVRGRAMPLKVVFARDLEGLREPGPALG